MKCPHCGKEHPDEFKVCPYTAKPIEAQSQYCKNESCDFHNPLPLSANFCPNCGKPLNANKDDKTPLNYDEIGPFKEGHAVVKKGNLKGLISKDGRVFFDCVYKDVLPFNEGRCGVCTTSGEWSFWDFNRKKIFALPSQYDVVSDIGFQSGLCRVSSFDEEIEDWLYGYIDKHGNIAINCTYSNADDFINGYAWVEEDEAIRFLINASGDKVTNGWDSIHLYENYAICHDFLHYTRTEIINLTTFESISMGKTNPHLCAIRNEICGYLHNDRFIWFNLNEPTKRQSIRGIKNIYSGTFREGVASLLASNEKYGFIDLSGNIVIPFDFDEARDFHDGLAAVKINGKWGFINHNGSVVIDAIYNEASDFSENLASLRLNGQLYVIDKNGEFLII